MDAITIGRTFFTFRDLDNLMYSPATVTYMDAEDQSALTAEAILVASTECAWGMHGMRAHAREEDPFREMDEESKDERPTRRRRSSIKKIRKGA